jgi:hypothetical protein
VFGGDAFDKGRDLEFGWLLIKAKQRYPDRVFLIIGKYAILSFSSQVKAIVTPTR